MDMTNDLKTLIAEAIKRVEEMADRWEDDAKLEDMVRAGLQGELDKFHETPRQPDVNLRLVRAAVDAESNARRFRKDAAALREVLSAVQASQPKTEGEGK